MLLWVTPARCAYKETHDMFILIVPPSLHMAPFLGMVLPAFKWLTFWGFCVGCAGKAVVTHP